MIIESQKIILLHPGKTGGTSVEHSLKDLFLKTEKLIANEEDLKIMFGFSQKYKFYLQHADLRFYKNQLNTKLENYKTITTVRNPYDRLVSCYYYNGKSKLFSFEEFITDHLEKHILCNKSYSVNHFSPQIYFCKINDYTVNHIIKLENFKKDLEETGINVSYHYSKTLSRDKDYQKYYNQKTKDLVYQLYKEDFEYLNYEY